MPISLTLHGRSLYVRNARGSGNISGFRVRDNGKLVALEGSTQLLSNGGTGDSPKPTQVSFSRDGDLLFVMEKATNRIDVCQVENGIAESTDSHPSSGMTPLGFALAKRHDLIVSEAFGGTSGVSAVSSYNVDNTTFSSCGIEKDVSISLLEAQAGLTGEGSSPIERNP